MKLLFVDHECHRKTRSADFFVEILRQAFSVTEHYYSRYYETGADEPMRERDVAVIWEFPISRRRFFFEAKRNVFVPMYDNEWGSRWQWRRVAWSGMGVISFCDKVTAHARRCGVTNLLDVRYFPDPAALPQTSGDPKTVFLWERGDISRQVAERLFPPSEGYRFVIKGANDFLPRERYLELLADCGIVIAPRRKEGIGMAFLEAMAMGKCVVAHDDATMNEYIVNGETGVLFNGDSPSKVDFETVERVRRNLARACAECRRQWISDAVKVNRFVEAQTKVRPSPFRRLLLAVSYPIYLAEGLLMRLRQRCKRQGGRIS